MSFDSSLHSNANWLLGDKLSEGQLNNSSCGETYAEDDAGEAWGRSYLSQVFK